jgi:hypothetical protein
MMACGVGAGHAQDFVAPLPQEDTPVLPTPEERGAAAAGIAAEIFRKKPWQLVNPAAPASLGDGKTNGTVSYSEEYPGKPKGFIVFGIDW